ncbi:MAG: spermidine/putrescine ABC transporter permease PotC, partial [Treponema sp.]|nr:spermidine/putrescine ABC transporter permease PotC [Treponema sp.]
MNFKHVVRNVITSLRPGQMPAGEASRHAKRAIRKKFSFSQTVFIITMVFLFLPLVILIISSFNDSTSMRWTGFSFRWYQRLFAERELWRSFWNSILIAVSSALTATIIGTFGAIGVN